MKKKKKKLIINSFAKKYPGKKNYSKVRLCYELLQVWMILKLTCKPILYFGLAFMIGHPTMSLSLSNYTHCTRWHEDMSVGPQPFFIFKMFDSILVHAPIPFFRNYCKRKDLLYKFKGETSVRTYCTVSCGC